MAPPGIETGNPGDISLIGKRRRIRLEIIAGWFGLVVALALGALRIGNSSTPERTEQAFGNIVFILILVTPYIAALLSAWLPARSRWVVLLPATLMSAASIPISAAGIILTPATVLLALAAWQSLEQTSIPKLHKLMFISASLLVFAIVVAAFIALFLHEDPRSWQYVTYEDGTTVWQSVIPATPGGSGGHLTPGVRSEGGKYVSNVITNDEAVWGAGLLGIAWISLVIIGRATKRYTKGRS